jgi:hypothetical protein
VDELVLGKSYDDVHKLMDSLGDLGPRHRKMPPHTLESVILLFGSNPEKLKSAILHLALDEAESAAWKNARKMLKNSRK